VFRIRPSKRMKDTICPLAPKKKHIVRTLSDSYGMDLASNYKKGG